MLVLQVTIAGVGRPGYVAKFDIGGYLLPPLVCCVLEVETEPCHNHRIPSSFTVHVAV